jgi:hypothetical protein
VHDDELCVTCETGDLETIDHPFFDCTLRSAMLGQNPYSMGLKPGAWR